MAQDDRAMGMQTLKEEGLGCTRCDLYRTATQVVWGEGNTRASIMLVGQGPGEVEDATGRPFVGPAGKVLDEALAAAGLDRSELWITNIIKHWATKVERGRTVNRAPKVGEVNACRIWLEGELDIVQPNVIVAIGGPAAEVLIDKKFKMSADHGQWREGPRGIPTLASYHPSYVLRLSSVDEEAYQRVWEALVADLREVARKVRELA